MQQDIRNVAIIAHVDHGKTTLVDNMLKQSGSVKDVKNLTERVMDSNDQEKERGITILAKCTSIEWNDLRINIVDTPGHADFGGEVERILSMVDGVVLLVDAAEGPMPQTKFVLTKALKLGLKPIVLINKIDRQDARVDEVLDEILELFIVLDATSEQLDFPVIYASGRSGWAVKDLEDERKDLAPLFETIASYIPSPYVQDDPAFRMLVTMREYNSYLGRVLTGRIMSGSVKCNQQVKVLNTESKLMENSKVTKILAFRGLEKVSLDYAYAGDIISIAGFEKASVTDTICDPSVEEALFALPIDPPTLSITVSVNDSPLAGTEGSKLTSSMIGERLAKEMENNVAITITQNESKEAFEVAGRGELQLGVLIESMRREGFELSISRPKVLFVTQDGQKLEPAEEIQVDVDDEFVGVVMQSMAQRKAEMVDTRASGGGKTRITFHGPSRGLIGYHSQFLSETRGTGLMNRSFLGYRPYYGKISGRRNGVLISNDQGEATAYDLFNLLDRGKMCISPGQKVYAGMIVGEHNRENDLEVNVLKGKKLSNVRAAGKDEAIRLPPPTPMTLEWSMSYIQDDERVEVTPHSIRLRKEYLDPNERKKRSRSSE
ncbi:GTP-binding protein TypA/BipA [Rickettsiales endosymbiont of Paramecium tredecaurelia]|uniref:translational GTPase TypA n=1 Tax=Candidatus Sarmatiella mevalonica TaxID=2770581 RepID=UPI003132F4A7|nr:GTP-binding protein TypA/BipA [Candidatus Sarmatiella mevalonica]